MSRVLAITGATGKSGRRFLEILQENESTVSEYFDTVRLLVRNSNKIGDLSFCKMKVDMVCGDLKDEAYVSKALCEVDTVLHIAGIHYSKLMVDKAIENGVHKLIFVHTTGIYSKYKKAGEEYRNIDSYCVDSCKSNGVVLTILRPTMIYGNINDNNVVKFIRMVDKFPIMPIVNGARYSLQPVHYEDLSIAYYQVLLNEAVTANKSFNLSGGRPILLRDMLSEIGKQLGKKVKFISCPFFIAYTGAVLIYCFSFGKCDYREKVQRLCEDSVYSHEDAACFGYSPRNFEDGIIEEVREYLKKK